MDKSEQWVNLFMGIVIFLFIMISVIAIVFL